VASWGKGHGKLEFAGSDVAMGAIKSNQTTAAGVDKFVRE